MSEKKYYQVILPLRLEWEPWYCSDLDLPAGRRVKVNFGKKEYLGVIHRVSTDPGIPSSRILPFNGVPEQMADITPEEISFWEFISDYYLCTIGEVYREAYPAVKIRSEEIPQREIDRLKEKLEKIEAELSSRQGSKRAKAEVTQRLYEKRQAILDRLLQLREHAPEPARKSLRQESKPVLLWNGDRTDTYRKAIENTEGDVLILSPDHISSDALERSLAIPSSIRMDGRQAAGRRREISELLRRGNGRHIVYGTRMALFLPFHNLGLVIVDEEQDKLYKQEEPAPRYNARDCALILARIHKADIILGSHCPSLDSIYNCRSGKFRLVGEERKISTDVNVIDISAERRKHGMQDCLSYKLIEEARRWKGPVTFIRAWEKEEELKALADSLFPDREIKIMTYRQARETDLQGVLVAILQADALVRLDDFKADEKGTQLVSSLSGRCGRLIIQTAVPRRFDRSRSIDELLEERRQFGYPPFTRMVETRLRGHSEPLKVYFLKKDSALAAEKEKIRRETGPDVIIDVDPA